MNPRIYVICVLCLSSCSVINNWDQLMTLNEYSHEKNDQRQMIELADRQFDLLKDDYRQNKVVLQMTVREIKKRYGNPFSMKTITDQEVWLYRYPAWSKKSDKMYLTFDNRQRLVTIDYVEDK